MTNVQGPIRIHLLLATLRNSGQGRHSWSRFEVEDKEQETRWTQERGEECLCTAMRQVARDWSSVQLALARGIATANHTTKTPTARSSVSWKSRRTALDVSSFLMLACKPERYAEAKEALSLSASNHMCPEAGQR